MQLVGYCKTVYYTMRVMNDIITSEVFLWKEHQHKVRCVNGFINTYKKLRGTWLLSVCKWAAGSYEGTRKSAGGLRNY